MISGKKGPKENSEMTWDRFITSHQRRQQAQWKNIDIRTLMLNVLITRIPVSNSRNV